MESSIVSGILAQALVALPKITAAELYEKCAGQIGETSLGDFRNELKKWLNDGTIPGYEARLGRTGGIYKIGSPNATMAGESSEKVKLDPTLVSSAIKTALETLPRITAGDLFTQMKLDTMTEAQFRMQLSQMFSNGSLPEFETRHGKTGGIYFRGAASENWIPEVEGDDETETSNGFSVQITPSLKIVHSDDRNWTIQKLCGETWQNKAYHSDIGSCINSVIKHAINGEFKCSNSLVQLKDLASAFKQMEGRFYAQVEKAVVVQA